MTITEAMKVLEDHNKWRCDNSVPSIYEQTDTKKLTKAIDTVISELKSDLLNRVMPCELEFKASLTLLRDLADIQNDAPLERDRKEWTEIMKSTYEFLDAHEA